MKSCFNAYALKANSPIRSISEVLSAHAGALCDRSLLRRRRGCPSSPFNWASRVYSMLHPSSCFEAYETLLQHAIGSAAHHCPFSDSDEMGVIDTGPGLLMVV